MKSTNPILDELHATREKLLAEAGGTIEGLVAKLREDQAKSGRAVIKNVDELPNSKKWDSSAIRATRSAGHRKVT
jgi:hypothetical protein